VVTGPDFVGCTTLLQSLAHAGYAVDTKLRKPAAADRLTFSQVHFDAQVDRWRKLSELEEALLVEDSPWAYYQRHVHHLPADVRNACQTTLSTLTLPDVTLALHTSGVTVGRRHPLWQGSPELYSPYALQQMMQLQHLHAPTFYVDATTSPQGLSKRVLAMLTTKIFKVAEANTACKAVESTRLEGMDHLLGGTDALTAAQGKELAQRLELATYTLDDEGMRRLARLAAVLKENPEIVNPSLVSADAALYY
jgi:hypothetical protein